MNERIVVAINGGTASHAALDWVINRALTEPCEVEVIVVEDLNWLPLGFDRSEYIRRYERVLANAKDYLSDRAGIAFVATRLLAGDPGEEIAVAGAMADALVMGSSTIADHAGALHGTLALRVAARTATRLTVVPAGWEPHTGKVVVGVAEDDSSDDALDTAITEVLATGNDLVLVHAWSLPAPFSLIEGALKPTYPTLESLHRKILKRAAARVALRAPQLEVDCVLRFGHAAAILADVGRDQAGLIVGRHHRNRLENLFLGSVGHDLILAAPAPVTVVPSNLMPPLGPEIARQATNSFPNP